jgi:beta-glucosidase
MLLALLFLACLRSIAQTTTPSNPQLASKELNDRVEALLNQMTLEEKIGRLVQYSRGTNQAPPGSKHNYDELATNGQVRSFLYVVSAERTNHFQHIAEEKSRLHIPLLFGMDVIHGHRTIFPAPLGLAASWDPAVPEAVDADGRG